jgi:hypothetical protein
MDFKSLWLINEALRVRKPSNSRVAMMFNLAMSLWYVHVCMHSLVCTYFRSSNVKSCKIRKVFFCVILNMGFVCANCKYVIHHKNLELVLWTILHHVRNKYWSCKFFNKSSEKIHFFILCGELLFTIKHLWP